MEVRGRRGQPCMGARDRSKEAVMGLHDVCLSSHPLGGSRPSLSLTGASHCPHSQLPWDSCHTGDPEREGGEESCRGRRQSKGGGQGPAWSPAPGGAETSLCQAHWPGGVDGQERYFPGREGGTAPSCPQDASYQARCVNTHTGSPDLALGESADTCAHHSGQSMPAPAWAHTCAPLKCL